MTVDVAATYEQTRENWADRSCNPHFDALRGSSILAIAREVHSLQAEGKEVHNLTIGDFKPAIFPIPSALTKGIQAAYEQGQTNYPPAVGTMELREAVVGLYERELGLKFPVESVLAGSGARPPIYSAIAAIVAEGDAVVYPVPSWNVNHYVFLNKAHGVPLVTKPEHGFMPTADDIAPHLSTARLIVINSPQNPSGSVIDRGLLEGICDAILAENARRAGTGERPLYLLYDAVYWRLVFGDAVHHTPFGLRPAMAPFTIMVDAVSKWWAGTGLRVGWCVAPPWVRAKMQALVGHMGAWPARPEQIATAQVLNDESQLGDFMPTFMSALNSRLSRLQEGIRQMQAEGMPIRCLDVQGAIYLSVQVGIIGKTSADGTCIEDDEAMRSYLLHEGGVAIVPFTAFGYPANTGWLRMSVGSVTMEAVEGTLAGLRACLAPFVTTEDAGAEA
jgi:aspartate aminotransferase